MEDCISVISKVLRASQRQLSLTFPAVPPKE
jgi:hypothetical protein